MQGSVSEASGRLTGLDCSRQEGAKDEQNRLQEMGRSLVRVFPIHCEETRVFCEGRRQERNSGFPGALPFGKQAVLVPD